MVKKSLIVGLGFLTMMTLAGCSQSSSKQNSSASASISSLTSTNKKLKAQVASLKIAASNQKDAQAASKASKAPSFGLNQEVVFQSKSAGKALGITLTAADQNWDTFAKSSLFNGKQANAVQLSLKFTNYSLAKPYLPSVNDFKVFDDDGNAAKALNAQGGQTPAAKGQTKTTALWYVFKKPFSKVTRLTIEYVANGQTLATWQIDR